MSEPTKVWIVYTQLDNLHGWFYAAVDTEQAARDLTKIHRSGDKIIDLKCIKNVDHVQFGEFRAVPIGKYEGPLIPE